MWIPYLLYIVQNFKYALLISHDNILSHLQKHKDVFFSWFKCNFES